VSTGAAAAIGCIIGGELGGNMGDATMLKSILTGIAIGSIGVLVAFQARHALHASLPRDMPRNARFVQTGYALASNETLGQWVGCRAAEPGHGDWCRVTDQRGSVVFEGEFLPLDSTEPVPADRLAVGQLDKARLWTFGPAEQAPVPVIPLEDGQTLVPVADRLCLMERWTQGVGESNRYPPASVQAALR
jgi:hypothetical protein